MATDKTSQHIVRVPPVCRRLPVPMPPMLPELIGLETDSRYFSLSYQSEKAWWNDGRIAVTFPYYAAYEQYTEHLVVAIHLFDVNLGSDEFPPTQSLLVDRQTAAVYVGDYKEVEHFLEGQHPPRQPLRSEEIEEIDKGLAKMRKMNLGELRDLGMFEPILGANQEQQQRCREMVLWLDQFITTDLIKMYVEAANAGEPLAYCHMHRIEKLMEEMMRHTVSSPWIH
jgi:hypothetical protein